MQLFIDLLGALSAVLIAVTYSVTRILPLVWKPANKRAVRLAKAKRKR